MGTISLRRCLQGSILMDGVDLLTLGLKEVRSRIAAIPQVRAPPCCKPGFVRREALEALTASAVCFYVVLEVM